VRYLKILFISSVLFVCLSCAQNNFSPKEVQEIATLGFFPEGFYFSKDSTLLAFSMPMGEPEAKIFFYTLNDRNFKDSIIIGKGNAPYEISAFGFAGMGLRNDTIFIYDRGKNHIKFLNIEGRYIGEVKVLDDFPFMVVHPSYFIFAGLERVCLVDINGNTVQEFEVFTPDDISYTSEEAVLTGMPPRLYLMGDTLFLCDVIDGKVKIIDLNSCKTVFAVNPSERIRGEIRIWERGGSISVVPRAGINSILPFGDNILFSIFDVDNKDRVGVYLVSKNGKIKGFWKTDVPIALIANVGGNVLYCYKDRLLLGKF